MTGTVARWFEDADLGEEYRGPLPGVAPLHDYFWAHAGEVDVPPDQFLDLAQHHRPPGSGEHGTGAWSRPVLPGDMCMVLALDVITAWAGDHGLVRSLDARFRRPIYLDDRIQWVVLVTGTEAPAGGSTGMVRLDLYFENERGERPVQAAVLVELPQQDSRHH